jgi:hypothetical protein
MGAKVRCVLRYTDAGGEAREQVFAGRGCFLKATGHRHRLKLCGGATRTAVVKQVEQPDGSWLDVERNAYE